VRVGFVGLGKMGRPIVARLVDADFAVVAYDANRDAREQAAASGAAVAETLGETATGADMLFLCLPDSPTVEAVLLGEQLLERLPRSALVVDLGSSQPLSTKKLAAESTARGLRFVDAPVSGGVAGAREGTLTVMAGGRDEDVAACRGAFDAIGRHVVHVGPVGAGHAAKALNNLLSAATLLATSEAMSTAETFGIDPETFLDIVNASSGRSFSTELKFPRYVVPGSFDSGFGLRLMAKDARTALELAREVGLSAPVSETVVATWETAAAELPADADHTRIAEWTRDRASAD
jgi:3-hydroxyisobutyrate dehydrogenase